MGNSPPKSEPHAAPLPGTMAEVYSNSRLPAMVLVVEAVLLPALPAIGNTGSPAQTWLETQAWSLQAQPRLFCSVCVDDVEVGRAVSFPSAPLWVTPRSMGSCITLRFFPAQDVDRFLSCNTSGSAFRACGELSERQVPLQDTPIAEVQLPFSRLARLGAPFFTSLWLGLDLNSQGPDSLQQAMLNARCPEVPKAVITMFRPARTDPAMSTGRALQPDIHAALADNPELECCGFPSEHRPSRSEQVRGLLEALQIANATTFALQAALFNPQNCEALKSWSVPETGTGKLDPILAISDKAVSEAGGGTPKSFQDCRSPSPRGEGKLASSPIVDAKLPAT